MHIVSQLTVSGGGVRLLPGGGFQFHHHQGKAVDKQDHIRAFLRVFNKCPLVGHGEIVGVRVAVVDQIDQGVPLLPILKVADGHAVLQVVRERHVLLQQRTGLEILELVHRLGDGLLRQITVDAPQGGQKRTLVQWGVVVPFHVGAVYVVVAQPLLEKLEDGVFVVGFGEVI